MENASKALIIAGAILLSILLISLGIMIFTQAQGIAENTGMNEADIQAFNSKFQKYEGTKKGSQVKALLNEIIAVNNDENDENDITLDATSMTGAKIDSTGWVNSSKTYKVEFGYTSGAAGGATATGSGRVKTVKITQ